MTRRRCIRLAWASLALGGCGYVTNPVLLTGGGSDTGSSSGESGESSSAETSTPTDSTTTSDDPDTTTTETGDEADTETGSCPAGSPGCPCLEGSTCDPGLECDAGLCTSGSACGNGELEDGELCDDGNLDSGDGCEVDCSPTRIEQISAGGHHSCLLTEMGDVICWGRNDDGQLGYGHIQTVGDNEAPAIYGTLPLVEPATAISAGTHHTCAVLASGTVTCWGANSDGRLGLGHIDNIGDNEDVDTIEPLSFGDEIEEVSAGLTVTCARSIIGTVYCWGDNDAGQLGLGHISPIGDTEVASNANSFVQIGGAALSVGAGSIHACALLNAGGVRCWGSGNYGALGYGNTTNVGDDEAPSSMGAKFAGQSITALTLGGNHTIILHPNAGSPEVRGWGRNAYGQLGVASTESHGDGIGPSYAVAGVSGTPVSLAAGTYHTCAILDDGSVSCWGFNQSGQLGYGSTQNVGDDELPSALPKLSFPAPATQLTAGYRHTCALLENQDLYCWGSNEHGQIGLGHAGTIGDDELATAAAPVALFD